MLMRFTTPPDMAIYPLYADILEQAHTIIAGRTGSGKSVAENGILYTAISDTPLKRQLILVDPKKVELWDYRQIPHCRLYASEPPEMVQALNIAMRITSQRYSDMQTRHLKKYDGPHIYVVIDELADLMCINRKDTEPILQRLLQIGRAARVHILACTQSLYSEIIKGMLKSNFSATLALRTRDSVQSKVIIDRPGAEKLPPHGKGIYISARYDQVVDVPMIADSEIQRAVSWWSDPAHAHATHQQNSRAL